LSVIFERGAVIAIWRYVLSWVAIKTSFTALLADAVGGRPLTEPWSNFVELIESTRDTPPYHLRKILELLEQLRSGRNPQEIAILDHGYGKGLVVLYLAALGYQNVHGVNLYGIDIDGLNRILSEMLGIREPRFRVYDGKHLPYEDNSIDFIISQQVLEHVSDGLIDSYYAEEGRVLKPSGLAFHQVPHRLVPYEAHTRTWLLHYFPPRINRALYRMMNCDMSFVETELFLRTPRFHRRQVERHIGSYSDLTDHRLINIQDFQYYDGALGLRRLMGRLVTAPIIGRSILAMLRNIVMLDTVGVKTSAHRN